MQATRRGAVLRGMRWRDVKAWHLLGVLGCYLKNLLKDVRPADILDVNAHEAGFHGWMRKPPYGALPELWSSLVRPDLPFSLAL